MCKRVIHFDLSAVNSFAPLKQTFIQNFALYCVIFLGGGGDKEIFQVSFKTNLVIGGSVGRKCSHQFKNMSLIGSTCMLFFVSVTNV